MVHIQLKHHHNQDLKNELSKTKKKKREKNNTFTPILCKQHFGSDMYRISKLPENNRL